jgi:hypothetical protein
MRMRGFLGGTALGISLALMATHTALADSGSEVGTWPASSLRETLTVFRAGQLRQGFSGWEGIETPSSAGLERSQFGWRNLNPAWNSGLACGSEGRPSGYLQTEIFENTFGRDLRVRIVLPVRFSLKTRGNEKRRVLNSLLKVPVFGAAIGGMQKKKFETLLGLSDYRLNQLLKAELFRVSILQLDSNTQQLVPIPTDQAPSGSESRFRVLDLCAQDSNCKSALTDRSSGVNLGLSEPVFSAPFLIPAGAKVHVRIDWSGSGVCDEGESSFLLGDQVRVVEVI